MRTLLLTFLFSTLTVFGYAETNARRGLALHGYDAVSYFSGNKPEKGSKKITRTHEGATYRFSSEAHAAAFIANPAKYLPAYGGYCAYAMLEGDKVDVDPETFKIVDGRLLLYYNGIWGDTLKQWNEKKETDQILIQQADRKWKALLTER